MTRLVSIAAVLVLAPCLAGCRTARPKQDTAVARRTAVAQRPRWVVKPPAGCALGIAQLHATAAGSKASAEAAARAALVRMRSARVKQVLLLRQRSAAGHTTQEMDLSTRVSTSGRAGRVRFVAYWTDQFGVMGHGPGTLYVLGCRAGS